MNDTVFKMVIYDLDGTLVDSFGDIGAAANQGMRACGKEPLPVEEWMRLIGHGVENLLRWGLGGGRDEEGNALVYEPPEEEIEKALAAMRSHYGKYPVVHSKPYPNVPEVLTDLRAKGMKQAILSNKIHFLVEQISDLLGLTEFVEKVMGESPTYPRKPNPEGINRLMEQFGVSPDEVLMVGDGEPDALVARNAGVKICMVTYGSRSREYLERFEPDWLVDDFKSVREVVRGVHTV